MKNKGYAKFGGQIRCIMGNVEVANRPFYRYGGHIELVRFKEYYEIPRGHEHDPIYTRSVFTRAFWANFSLSFPRKRS